MKATCGLIIVFLAYSAPLAPSAIATTDLAIGDTREDVIRVLGEPRGSITSGPYQLLQFERGRVELHDGLVTQLGIVSEAVAQERRFERERAAEVRERLDAERRARRYAEGVDAREYARSDETFQLLSGREQLDFWNDFRRRYPEVRVDVEFASAAARARREIEKQRENERLARMERRIAEAEARARDAERQAEDLAEDLERRRRRTVVSYSAPYYSTPYCAPVYTPSRACKTPVKKISYVSGARYSPHIKTRTHLGGGHLYTTDRSSSYVTCRYPTFSQYNGTSHSRVLIRY